MNNPAPLAVNKTTTEKLWYQQTVEESLAGLQSGPAGLSRHRAAGISAAHGRAAPD